MDEVFRALADPNRRLLLDSLNDRNGQTLRELCGGLSMARQSVSKHLAVLETANLVTTLRRGREKLHYVNAEPIVDIADRWIDRFDATRLEMLAEVKTVLESPTMAGEFSYTTYIRTTPERLWQAITNPAFSHSYMGHAIESEWQKGSSYVWVEDGLRIEDPEQVIVESDPYQRLAFTFHTCTPELEQVAPDLSEHPVTPPATERRSQVSFDIDPVGDQVKLTMTHGGFDPGSTVRDMISHGWPLKLSGLKSGLELAD
ncbi:ArsR family transcriptional regulator [Mycolicibacterium setense]|uniref:ArsR family transcriptional regulator n=1 Tax=Mycolicibacterium setense TaxID=431269 RepID=A0ABR4YVQ6_9MYCO|nr:metalloregulator ArsR/SmtB family transcription factor [Mycolicibacterium setense]KHO25391.1 ArsR family transcriptional regulator [Mycolicibacterium setense]